MTNQSIIYNTPLSLTTNLAYTSHKQELLHSIFYVNKIELATMPIACGLLLQLYKWECMQHCLLVSLLQDRIN